MSTVLLTEAPSTLVSPGVRCEVVERPRLAPARRPHFGEARRAMGHLFLFDTRAANDNALSADEVALARGARAAREAAGFWLRARRFCDGARVLVRVRGGFERRACDPANDDGAPRPRGAL